MNAIGNLPRVATWYWGAYPMSYLRYASLVSFKKHHPEWLMTLVTRRGPGPKADWNEEQDYHYYQGKDYRDDAKFVVDTVIYVEDHFPIEFSALPDNLLADMTTWLMLKEFGGIKCDMDLLWIDSINYEAIRNVGAAFCKYRNNYAVGLVAGKYCHPLFKTLYQRGMERMENGELNDYQSLGPNLVREYAPRYDVTIMPNSWVYPFVDHVQNWIQMCSMPFREDMDVDVPEDCVGIHWYAGSRIAREWNSKGRDYVLAGNNLIGKQLRRLP